MMRTSLDNDDMMDFSVGMMMGLGKRAPHSISDGGEVKELLPYQSLYNP